jgi:peptide/nickel transport system permease protein
VTRLRPAAPASPAAAAGRVAFGRRLLRSPTQRVVWTVLLLLLATAAGAGVLAPADPNAQDLLHILRPPAAGHLLGTDTYGRDEFSRLLYGLRSSLLVGAATTAGVAVIGISLGLVAGYARGLTDVLISRVVDVGLALPALVLALALITAMGAGLRSTIIALTAGYAPYLARVARSLALRLRAEAYVESARVTGVPGWRIAVRHVLPNMLGPSVVQLTLIFAFAVVGEAGLSFVGLGVQPPSASLGNMLADGADHTLDAPLLGIAPGLVIALMLVTLLFAGDGLRDALDLRRRS